MTVSQDLQLCGNYCPRVIGTRNIGLQGVSELSKYGAWIQTQLLPTKAWDLSSNTESLWLREYSVVLLLMLLGLVTLA